MDTQLKHSYYLSDEAEAKRLAAFTHTLAEEMVSIDGHLTWPTEHRAWNVPEGVRLASALCRCVMDAVSDPH